MLLPSSIGTVQRQTFPSQEINHFRQTRMRFQPKCRKCGLALAQPGVQQLLARQRGRCMAGLETRSNIGSKWVTICTPVHYKSTYLNAAEGTDGVCSGVSLSVSSPIRHPDHDPLNDDVITSDDPPFDCSEKRSRRVLRLLGQDGLQLPIEHQAARI